MRERVLDATCGGRMMWFEKEHELTVFMDRRVRPAGFFELRPRFEVMPDVQADFRDMPFADGLFSLVLFDPPHIIRETDEEVGIMAAKYGRLAKSDWKDVVRRGASECWRVLKPGGTMVVKWAEGDRGIGEVVDLLPSGPIFGTRAGRTGHGVWLCLFKEDQPE